MYVYVCVTCGCAFAARAKLHWTCTRSVLAGCCYIVMLTYLRVHTYIDFRILSMIYIFDSSRTQQREIIFWQLLCVSVCDFSLENTFIFLLIFTFFSLFFCTFILGYIEILHYLYFNSIHVSVEILHIQKSISLFISGLHIHFSCYTFF